MVSDWQPENILCMLVTFAVLKLETSSEVSDEQFSNIRHISVTFEVLKLDTSSDASAVHPLNI